MTTSDGCTSRPLRLRSVDFDRKSADSVPEYQFRWDRAKESPDEVNAFYASMATRPELDVTMSGPVYGGVSQGTMLGAKQHFGCWSDGRKNKGDPKDCKMGGSHFPVTSVPTAPPRPTSLYVAEGIATERGGEQALDDEGDHDEDEGLGVRLGGRRPLVHRRAHRLDPADPGVQALRRKMDGEWGERREGRIT